MAAPVQENLGTTAYERMYACMYKTEVEECFVLDCNILSKRRDICGILQGSTFKKKMHLAVTAVRSVE
jgi:hypothetical protein